MIIRDWRRRAGDLFTETISSTADFARQERFRVYLWGYGVAGVTAAFFVAPLLQFGDAGMLATFGLRLATAILALSGGVLFRKLYSATLWLIFAVIAFLIVGDLTRMASLMRLNQQANAARCLAIQRDMLSAQPRRADGPDLFQALGCRVQGGGSVFAKPTKLEQAAGHSLFEGGRP